MTTRSSCCEQKNTTGASCCEGADPATDCCTGEPAHTPDAIREAVRVRYAGIAASGKGCGCESGGDSISADLYSGSDLSGVPESAVRASLGCGNPVALAHLRPGQVVLDLGSGAGIDVLLSARRVGAEGLVYGLDMTDEMLEEARANAASAGASNVRFLKGTIEDIPLPDASVDVILSNCVINLSVDKGRVLREAYRVLRHGGQLAISDIVFRRGDIPDSIRSNLALWTGCVAGALDREAYLDLLVGAGFRNPSIEFTRVFDSHAIPGVPEEFDGVFGAAFVRAEKS